MTTLAIVLGLVLVGFIIGFASCALSVSTRRKEERIDTEAEIKWNLDLISSLSERCLNQQDTIDNLTDECLNQKDAIDDLPAQIKDMKIVRTKPETFDLFTYIFIKNAETLAESNHELFMKCINEVLIDTYIAEVLFVDHGNNKKLYRLKMNDSSFACIDSVEKLVHYVKQSYDMKQLLKASKN